MDNYSILKKEIKDLKLEFEKIQDILENSPTPDKSLAKKAIQEIKIHRKR